MEQQGFSLDFVGRIWNDKTGDRIEFGEDRDGLGLVSIRSVESDGKCHSDVIMSEEQARLLIVGLTNWLDNIPPKQFHVKISDNASK